MRTYFNISWALVIIILLFSFISNITGYDLGGNLVLKLGVIILDIILCLNMLVAGILNMVLNNK